MIWPLTLLLKAIPEPALRSPAKAIAITPLLDLIAAIIPDASPSLLFD